MGMIELDYAPPVPGLTFRLPTGDGVLKEMHRVWQAGQDADNTKWVTPYEDYAMRYKNRAHFDFMKDVLIAEVNGDVVGYCMISWNDMPLIDAIAYVTFGAVDPDWRRKGIGQALLTYGEARIDEMIPGHPPEKAKFIRNFRMREEEGKQALLEKNGYRVVDSYAHLVRPDLENIPDVPAPEGIELRPLDPKDARKLWDSMNEGFKDHVDYVQPTEEGYENWHSDRLFQPEIFCVAWAGDEIVGQITNFIDHAENEKFNLKKAWTENISVLPAYRGKGLARAMLSYSMRILKEKGIEQVALGAHLDNPYKVYEFYQSMGYERTGSEYSYQKDLSIGGKKNE